VASVHASASKEEQLLNEPSSRPQNIPMCFRGFERNAAEGYASTLGALLHEIGKIMDISTLDGMTIAFDYDEALANLDRGYETIRTLTKTTEFATGVAMTPAVLRDSALKSHIVLSGEIVLMLDDDNQENFKSAVHTIAHECAHVEITATYDKCFPNEILRKFYDTVMESWRWDVINACWEEYAACRIASNIGHDPVAGYEEVFVLALNEMDDKITQLVQNFHGGNADQLVGPVFGVYGTVMKFTCYLLGAMAGTKKTLASCESARDALSDHWFEPYFERLKQACEDLYDQFGNWSEKSGFNAIGDIVEDIVTDRVMKLWHWPDGTYTIYIHLQT